MEQYPLVYRCRLGCSGRLGIRVCGLWLAGIWAGCWLCRGTGTEVAPLLCQAAVQEPRGFAGLGVGLIPLALTLGASAVGWRWLVWLLCALRGFLLGSALGWLSLCFGQAAGMLAVLLLFSLLLSSPVLLWYWWRCLNGERAVWGTDFLWSLAALTAVWAADQWVVAPFLQKIFTG